MILGYKELVAFDDKYRANGLEILAFPCNQFANEEPGTKEQIRNFVNQYGVKFQMFQKINVKGPDAHPLYKWLQSQKEDKSEIEWNFEKFIINRQGIVQHRLSPKAMLKSAEDNIKNLLSSEAVKEKQIESNVSVNPADTVMSNVDESN